jgi:pimeloyl-ACP methyl ester carboxylesterase
LTKRRRKAVNDIMAKRKPQNPADFIVPLNINGMDGRMLHLPGPKNAKYEVLFVYGHHSSLERWWGIAKFMSRYAAVTMPDLPGFGAMDSFYKIGKTASIDNYADYLASFVKLRYKHKRPIVVGMSFGFIVITRMLQRYPDLLKRIDKIVSFAGFAHRDDFTFSKTRWWLYYHGAKFFSHRLTSLFFRYVCLHPAILRAAYGRTHNAREKFDGIVGEELEEITRFEIRLWHDNDVRSYMKTTTEFLDLDNCRQRIEAPVYHVAVEADRYFDNQRVEQHFRVVFSDFVLLKTLKLSNHAPSVIADEKAAADFIPPKFRRLLQGKETF